MPERTSISRAIGFNKAKVNKFYELLQSTLFNSDGTRRIPPENGYNVDETGITVCQKSKKIV
jgi:hypothetical protein